ncbi:MAG: coenzyme F420-0:L-glutamate ligase [Candidatus Lokiarchaeota archaeon]|nr:coenzyme F420-0:L-glutamate ligase [Candidatus Lokiarchaeota archaeon]
MELHPISTPIIYPKNDLVKITLDSIINANLSLKEKDILVFAETVVGTVQNRIVDLNDVKEISEKASELAEKYTMDPRVVQIVLDEADVILGGVKTVLLTQKEGILIANAGADRSNSGGFTKIKLFPENLHETVFNLHSEIKEKTGINQLGVIIADSRVQPMKRGVIGVAIAVAGMEPIDDSRGKKDLFGRPLEITTRAVADDLVSAAELLMGEANEQVPIVLIRGAPVTFTDRKIMTEEMLMPREECLFMNVFKDLAAYQNPEYKKS